MTESGKVYLGDGLYAQFNGFGIILTAENGVRVTNIVYLEMEVYEELKRFAEPLMERKGHGK